MSLRTEKKTLTIRGESFEVDYSYCLDEEGEHYVTAKMGDANLKQAWDQYNAKHGTNVGPFATPKHQSHSNAVA